MSYIAKYKLLRKYYNLYLNDIGDIFFMRKIHLENKNYGP
jgi:hypothetical protein